MLKAIVVGAGHRGLTYASFAQNHPDQLQIVGVVDPLEARRKQVADLYHLRPSQCFATVEDLVRTPRIADFAINATMDRDHVPTSVPLLAAGYHLLLEKPFATNEEEMWELVEATRRYERLVAICHVLRFAPFYRAIKQKVADGAIGQIINVQATEHVSYHHMAVAFVRGKWNSRTKCFSPMLMAKCCHDLDLIAWLKSGVAPLRVSSFGSNMQFRPERAPAGSGTRCLADCSIESECSFSAKKHYVDNPWWSFYAWDTHLNDAPPGIRDRNPATLTRDEKLEWLRTSNPYGKCVWRCDNDNVDHQSVAIDFADGSTATLNMVGGSARAARLIHLVGTHGEISGCMEDAAFTIRKIDPTAKHGYVEERIDLNAQGLNDGHGGGDLRLVDDFVRVLRGESPSISTTTLADSVAGHLIGFCADRALTQSRVVTIPTRS